MDLINKGEKKKTSTRISSPLLLNLKCRWLGDYQTFHPGVTNDQIQKVKYTKLLSKYKKMQRIYILASTASVPCLLNTWQDLIVIKTIIKKNIGFFLFYILFI